MIKYMNSEKGMETTIKNSWRNFANFNIIQSIYFNNPIDLIVIPFENDYCTIINFVL